MNWGWGWRPYVSVAERRERAAREMTKLRKKGLDVQPVVIAGQKIARTFWGQSWCNHLESFSDYSNRLPRGRTYVRNGSVCHLEISSGKVSAMVSGSEIYKVDVTIKKLAEHKWSDVKKSCSGQIGSLLELLQGKLSSRVMSVVTDRGNGLFPLPGEITLKCSCPDLAAMCKHVAAVLYGAGARLDEKPELLFLLRGVDHEELIESGATIAVSASGEGRGGRRRIAHEDLADVFGIEMVDERPSSVRGQEKRTASQASSVKRAPLDSKTRTEKGAAQTAQVLPPVGPSIGFSPTGKTVRDLRTRLDMSQSQLALLIGVTGATVGNWERQKGLLKLQSRTLIALGDATKLTKKQALRQLSSR